MLDEDELENAHRTLTPKQVYNDEFRDVIEDPFDKEPVLNTSMYFRDESKIIGKRIERQRLFKIQLPILPLPSSSSSSSSSSIPTLLQSRSSSRSPSPPLSQTPTYN
jgi:hypothetical protein